MQSWLQTHSTVALNPTCRLYATHVSFVFQPLIGVICKQARHKHYNTLLNTLKASSTDSPQQASPLAYKHVHLMDSFYPSDNPQDREKIRVTRDEKTGKVTECMRKIRLGDLNVYSPKRAADWRISVSLEVPGRFNHDSLLRSPLISQSKNMFSVSHPVGTSTHSRKKDRMSYSHEEFVIDLTQVTTSASPSMPVSPQLFYNSSPVSISIGRRRPKFFTS